MALLLHVLDNVRMSRPAGLYSSLTNPTALWIRIHNFLATAMAILCSNAHDLNSQGSIVASGAWSVKGRRLGARCCDASVDTLCRKLNMIHDP